MTIAPLPAPKFPAAPPLGYWTARTMAEDRTKAAKYLQMGIDQFIDETMQQVDAIEAGLGFRRQPDPMKRLAAYLAKPETNAEAVALVQAGRIQIPFSWETQRAYLPHDYEEDWADMQNLRERAERGEFAGR